MMFLSGDIAIHAALPKDVQGILSCLSEAFAPHRDQYTPEAYADIVLNSKSILRRMHEMRVSVAVKLSSPEDMNEQVVGTIATLALGADLPDQDEYPVGSYEPLPREGHIRGMAVRPEMQGSGLAEMLLGLAEESLAREGCSFVTLDTTEPLQRAIRFYENRGYRASGSLRDFYGMKLIEYEKQLI